jgi:hypothetical protein
MYVYSTGHPCALNPLAERQIVDLSRKANKDECQSIDDEHIPYPVGVGTHTPQVRKGKQESEVTPAEVLHGRLLSRLSDADPHVLEHAGQFSSAAGGAKAKLFLLNHRKS